MSMKVEEWRDVPGYSGFYQISDWGRVRSFYKNGGGEKAVRTDTPRFLKVRISESRGCASAMICLRKPGTTGRSQYESMPRFVALTWLGGVPPGMRAYHRDGNARNNSRWNIEFRRPIEVMNSVSRSNRMSVLKIDNSLTIVECFGSIHQAAAASSLSYATVREYCSHMRTRSIFAPDGFIYAFDDDAWMRRTLDRARAELDALGIRYNDPFTERYYDLETKARTYPDAASIAWEEAPALAVEWDSEYEDMQESGKECESA